MYMKNAYGVLFGVLIGMFAALSLEACSRMNSTPYPASPEAASAGNLYSGLGVVQSVELVQSGKTGLGAVAGNQVGARRANTVAGGTESVGRQVAAADAYRITVRMENSENQVLTQSTNAGFRAGDRVRLDNGKLQRY